MFLEILYGSIVTEAEWLWCYRLW